MPSRIQRLKLMDLDQLSTAWVTCDLRLKMWRLALRALSCDLKDHAGKYSGAAVGELEAAVAHFGSKVVEEQAWKDAVESTLADLYPPQQHPRGCHCTRCYQE